MISLRQPVRNLQGAEEKAATTQKEKPLDMIFPRQLVQRQQNVRGKAVTIRKARLSDMISLRQPVRKRRLRLHRRKSPWT